MKFFISCFTITVLTLIISCQPNKNDEQTENSMETNLSYKVTIEDVDKNTAVAALQELSSVEMVDTTNENSLEVQSRAGQSSTRDIFKLCVDKGWVLTQMTPIETKLEDVFRELTMK